MFSRNNRIGLAGQALFGIVRAYICATRNGEVAEWFKAHAWNACVRESVPRVRIPPSPPNCKFGPHYHPTSSNLIPSQKRCVSEPYGAFDALRIR